MPVTPDLAPPERRTRPNAGDSDSPPKAGREVLPETAPDKTDGPTEVLLCRGARAVVYGWTHYLSPTALPLFRTLRAGERINRLLLRDVAILAFFVASVATFVAWPRIDGAFFRAAVGGLAIYRIVDIALTLVGVGIFGSLRHDASLHELPRHRVQRILVAILLNYLELMFWFATLYYWVADNDPRQFDAPVTNLRQAFFVSMSTLTTTGYGKHSPVGSLALALSTAQAILGLVVLVMVIGGLVGSLKGDGDDVPEPPLAGPERYVLHVLAPPMAYLACVGVAVWGIGVG